ncbi:MAG: ammonium transporter [Motilibacteraceae bacterium]
MAVGQVDAADTGWLLVCTALVLLMTPGLAFFYAGMVRAKNVLSMLLQNYVAIAVVSTTWVVVGYALAFGRDHGGLLGGLAMAGFHDAERAVPGLPGLTVPPVAFAAFQMMFAVITAALLTGAVADRVRFGAFVTFVAVWSVVVYAPLAHWVFSPHGWLARIGVLDFAGGTVVEICSGASALALVLVVGNRAGFDREAMHPHNLPLTLLGAGLLWFGWFGFNAGSALHADALAAHALVTTHLAGVGGLIGWLALEKRAAGHATTLGGASGAVAGLVAVTPAAGYVGVLPSLLLGALAGAACLLAIRLKFRFRYDDALDVVGVHYVGGVVGTLFVGLFASHAVNGAVHHQGLLLGGGLEQLGLQLVGVLAASVWAFGVTYAVARGVDRFLPLRASRDDELAGLDSSQHAETAYELGTATGFGRFGA